MCVVYCYKICLDIYWSYPVHIWYMTPERQDSAVAHEGLMDPCDLWVSAEAPDWLRVHSPDLQAKGSPTHGCLKHLKASVPPVWWAS